MREEEVLKGQVETERPASPDDPVAAALRGFGPLGIVAILVILASNFVIAPINAILVLVWARLSRTPWCEIGYVRPKSWIGSVVVGIVFGCAFKFIMKAMVMPLLGAPPTNAAYHFLVGNKTALPGMLFLLMLDAGFGEETVYRGWMFERLGKLFGRSVWATTLIVLVTSILFSLAHYSVQGLPGSEQALITGMVFGTIYAVTGRLFVVMVTHVAFDVMALAMIYWNFETAVAHLIFK
jgi:membrane protease YdiL (CAAX protease family)